MRPTMLVPWCSLTCLLQGTDLLSKQVGFLVQARKADLVLSRSGPETKSMFIQFFSRFPEHAIAGVIPTRSRNLMAGRQM